MDKQSQSMRWEERARAIQPGDRVAYTPAWLRSTGTYSGDLPQAKGKVLGLQVISPDVTLAEIEWDRPDLPARVNVRNLCRVNSREYGA
jgi:hypothetical protein